MGSSLLSAAVCWGRFLVMDSSPKRLTVSLAAMPSGRRRGERRTPRRRVRNTVSAFLLALLLGWSAPALAQGGSATVVLATVVKGTTYLDVSSLALALGDVVTPGAGILTWRGEQGVVTFFAGSADVLLQSPGNAGPDDWVLSAPPLDDLKVRATSGASGLKRQATAEGWAIPLDAVQLLGVAFEETAAGLVLHAAAGSFTVALAAAPVADSAETEAVIGDSWEATTVNGVPALRFFAEPDKSLLLLDLDLAPLAFPEATAAVDDAVARAGSDHALLLVVTSLSRQPWSSSLTFEQDGRVLETRHPYRLRVYQGDPESVAPGAGVAAVVLLPPSFSLYRPLAVSWESIQATVTFRR